MRDRVLWVAWRASGVCLVNLVPLWLILGGFMETADLLLAYVIQTGVALVGIAVVLRRTGTLRRRLGVRETLTVTFLVALLWLALARRVAGSVDWTPGRTGVSALTGVVLVAGTAWALRDRDRRLRVAPVARTQAWHLFVLTIGVFAGLNAAESYPVLVSHGWTPSQVGDAWSFPFGTLFGRLAGRLDVDPQVWPAVMIVSLMTVNDTLLTVRREIAEPLEVSPARS